MGGGVFVGVLVVIFVVGMGILVVFLGVEIVGFFEVSVLFV